MTDAPNYQFLSWVRRGVAAALTGSPSAGRATLPVSVTVSRTAGDPLTVDKTFELLGPADVFGLDPRQVIRTDPAPGATDAEPNYLALAELDRPDLPWLFTPAAPGVDQRLLPWLVLIVVEQGSGVVRLPPVAPGAPPVLELHPEAEPARQLPDLRDSWAWAHGQVLLSPTEAVDAVLGRDPQRDAARLICPRQLEPTTSYLAAIVPAFASGCRAGLNQDPDGQSPLQPAWTDGVTSLQLPMYYSWEFRTGIGGDFESMVRSLRPQPLPENTGRQRVFVGAAGAPLPEVDADHDGGVVELPGALVLPGSEEPAWPSATQATVRTALAKLLNTTAQRTGVADGSGDGPPVIPPLYGQWHAASAAVPGDTDEPAWLATLNLDPRHRAVAGVAARIVEAEQDRFVAQAWAQVGAVEEANRLLRLAQLAREVRGSVLRRHVAPLPAAAVVGITSAVHSRLPTASATVAAAISASRLPDAVVTARFRRTTAPRSPLVRRMPTPVETARSVTRLDAGQLRTGISGAAPDGLFGFATDTPAAANTSTELRTAISTARQAAATHPSRPLDRGVLTHTAVTSAVAVSVAKAVTDKTASTHAAHMPDDRLIPAGHQVGTVVTGQIGDVAELRAAADVVATRSDALVDVAAPPAAPAAGIAALAADILGRVDPHRTVTARINTQVIAPHRQALTAQRDPLEQIQAAPTFDQPAWELLRDHDPDLLLPGVGAVPQDSVTLCQTNPRFSEALLVGLNHEMARELLWRGYPTDQRGTCFARFWAPAGADDVPALTSWLTGDLGTHTVGTADDQLVLLLRGRLLFRYPHTVIYAAPDAAGRPDLSDTAVQLPLFRGRIDPDVAFVGFPLTLDEARTPPGWWFVLEQQPTAPRFGLDVATRYGTHADPVNSWSDLSWGHLADDAQALAALDFLRTDMTPPSPATGPRWGASASDMAAILLQQPVRVAIRAADLLRQPT